MSGAHLAGIGVSPGTAIGPVARMGPPPVLPAIEPAVTDTGAETVRAGRALAQVADCLQRRAGALRGVAAEVLVAESLMAADPALAVEVEKLVLSGRAAPWAVTEALASHREVLLAAGGYLAERAADLDDIARRAVAVLLGVPMPGLPDPGHPFVLVAGDLAPADTAALDPARVLAIVTEGGGPTSHTAILSKTLGIPAVVCCPGVTSLADGRAVGVDGATGEVVIDPDPMAMADLGRREAQRGARRAASRGPGRTRDGYPVELLINVGGPADVAGVAEADAEGVGLLRTEFLFLDRADAPSVDEQRSIYASVFAPLQGRKVVVRTLDAGSDKPLAFASAASPPTRPAVAQVSGPSAAAEPNPALGVRGLRLCGRLPHLLDDQLRALQLAAADTAADVWVMAPMVSTPVEAVAFAARVRDHRLPVAGVMIEVPAAALRAGAILAGVDFVSIGTNDLSQYTFAADRQLGALAELLDPWQPALLQLIAVTARSGRDAGKPVSVCGEAASDPGLAVVLAGLGVTSLSMAAGSVAEVRHALAERTLEECQAAAAAALGASGPEDARRAAGHG